MGGDIAAWCALQGLTVTLQDREMKYVEPALARARKLFARRVRRDDARSAAEARLSADIAGDGVARADVVIEAIFENLGAKQELLRTVEARARPDCVIATNTSSIPLEAIMTCLRDPARLIGLHFFNPVAKLPLVEVVRTAATAEAALAAGLAFTRQIGKLPLPCRSHPGFLVNRILAPYLAEAMTLAEEGVPLPDIDAAATGFGMPMGPVELADSVGLDVALHVARILSPLIGRPVAPEIERLVVAGHLGQKTGRGFYVYQDGRPVKPRGSRDDLDPEIRDRLIMALLNESAHCLHEGIVADADLVDAGVIFGTGFAPFRGGPLHYARERGVGEVTAILARLAERHGPRFEPSAGWGKLGAL
jgi:3-hydroxyacyl-CoA dehydrogenase/enoyl-CoA hydratase/3-hydroxybutyryl-CoA epimerase